MKNLILLFLVAPVMLSAQTMRDSTAYQSAPTKKCVVTVNYDGQQVRDTLTAEQVSAWINVRGGQRDAVVPMRDIISHLRAEIGRCHGNWLARMAEELGSVDADDTQTLAQIRAARTAIRLKYRSWMQPYTVRVPVLEPAP